MNRLSRLILVFASLSFAFLLLTVFFRVPFPLFPLMSYQDAIDLLTPLVLIPLYWLLFKYAARTPSSTPQEIAFMLLAVLWVVGHGMHLAANSISNLIAALASRGALDVSGTDIYHLTYFYDEVLSHTLWYLGLAGLAALLIYREWRSPAGEHTVWWSAVLSGIVYGFTLFAIFLEGQSVPIGLTFTALVVILTLIWGRKRLSRQPLLAFFFAACLLALLLFTVWGLYWGGFPQFTDVGLI